MRLLIPAAALALCGCYIEAIPGGEPTPGEVDSTPAPCALAADLSVDRVWGVFPMPLNASVTVSCAADATVAWEFGDGAVAQGLEAAHLYMGSGAFTVRAVVTAGDETVTVERVVEVDRPSCPTVAESLVLGSMASDELDEASGLAHSRKDGAILWTHNDSGDTPRLFAMSTGGDHLGSFELDGAPEGDWEDSVMGVDPQTGAARLYIGDIGDNAHGRDEVLVHIVDEPDLDPEGGDQSGPISAWSSMELTYPSGSPDSEALLFDPVTGDLYLVAEDEDGDIDLYRKPAPHEPGSRTELERVAELALDGKATGGDFSPDGRLIAVRTGGTAFVWIRDRSGAFIEALYPDACVIPLPDEVRGEGLAFSSAGDGWFTVSEEPHQPIHFQRLDPTEQPCNSFVAQILADPPAGPAPLEVQLGVEPRCVPEGIASVSWDLGDGTQAEPYAFLPHTFTAEGTYTVRATITDLTGATASSSVTIEVGPQVCPTVGDTEEWGTVEFDAIVEASGIVHSAIDDGILWTHNDGGGAEIFAMDLQGNHRGVWDLDVTARDVEDLATGWNEQLNAQALYLADVGDNAVARDDIRVFIVAEPTVPEGDPPDERVDDASVGLMTLTYPDGPHNCESMFIDPISDDLIIITKDGGGDTAVFRKPGPHVAGGDAELEWIADLDLARAPFSGSRSTTAADIHPDGWMVAVRTYSHVWIFLRNPLDDFASTFAEEPCDGRAPSERQGEAIAFENNGDGYIVVSEGRNQPIKYRPIVPIPGR